MNKLILKYFVLVFSLGVIFNCHNSLLLADGGMIPIWPQNVSLWESDQNAIAAWNGTEEILMLSTNARSSAASTTVLRIIPLASNPSKVELGTLDAFNKLRDLMNAKIQPMRKDEGGLQNFAMSAAAPSAPAEITFQEVIGPHDITVVKVNDVDGFLNLPLITALGINKEQITPDFRTALNNYMLRDIKYFSFDKITVGTVDKSVEPIIYRFASNYFFYPIKITASSIAAITNQGGSDQIHLFAITKNPIIDTAGVFNERYMYWRRNPSLSFTSSELNQVAPAFSELFTVGGYVTEFGYRGQLANTKNDIIMYSTDLWKNNFRIGTQGADVLALQKMLINEELWNSNVPASGYFGPTTFNAVIRFQEKYSSKILVPLNLTSGTGFVGPFTRGFLAKFQLQ